MDPESSPVMVDAEVATWDLTKDRPLHDYENERIFERNRLAPRAYFIPEHSLLLNGRWRFHYAPCPASAPSKSETLSESSKIDVPGHWQLQGYGKPHYTNVQFPFPVDPPNVPSENPTGTYETDFRIPRKWETEELSYRLRFEGVDSSFHISVNGIEVGYSQGSRNPAEFDVTHLIRSGENGINTVRVKVYQWCDGSYIEDQDQWWLSGPYRRISRVSSVLTLDQAYFVMFISLPSLKLATSRISKFKQNSTDSMKMPSSKLASNTRYQPLPMFKLNFDNQDLVCGLPSSPKLSAWRRKLMREGLLLKYPSH